MRGASRCVWCTKVSRLIEAELFAEQIQRPAQNGRALLCAANHESNRPWHEKKESTGSNLCSPFVFRRATGGSRAQRKVRGVKRGQETMFGVLSPFVSAGRPRHPRTPKAATVRTLTLSVKSPPAASRCIGGTAYPLLRVKKEERSSPPTAKIKPFSPASAPQRISRSVCRSDTQHPSAQWFRRASVRRSMQ